jgi:hypothetical protein
MDVLGDAPLIGLSASGELSPGGFSRGSVVVGLLAGRGIQACLNWQPGYADDNRAAIRRLAQGLNLASDPAAAVLLAADGMAGDGSQFEAELGSGAFSLSGSLAGGDLGGGQTFQLAGSEVGSGGLAGMALRGQVAVGVGQAHPWSPVGAPLRVTRVQGNWVRSLNEVAPGEIYARMFGHSAREWGGGELAEMLRIYPLGLEIVPGRLEPRLPLRMEADGSLRMNTALPEGAAAYLMVGSVEHCRKAAGQATRDALDRLGTARPVCVWVSVDAAWQILLDDCPEAPLEAVWEILGPSAPVLFGGYTFGQIGRLDSPDSPPGSMNGYIQVTIFGEPTE